MSSDLDKISRPASDRAVQPKEISKLERIIEIRTRAYERLALCPDHRDKANGRCIVCVAEERAKAEIASSDRAVKEPAHCRCGVAADVSHYCSALDHCWIGKREPPNPYREHLAANGKPIDGYPEQQA